MILEKVFGFSEEHAFERGFHDGERYSRQTMVGNTFGGRNPGI